MIASIGRTIQSAMAWPTMNLAQLSRALASPYFADDYNQLKACYQCHGNPLGRIYVNAPWPAVCFDVDNEVLYLKQDLAIGHNGWQSSVVPPPVNDPVFDNLTHYWSLDEASGTRDDSKGILHLSETDGVVASASGKDSLAVDSTTAHYLKSAGNLGTSFTFPFSIALWCYVRSLPASATDLYRVDMFDGLGTDTDMEVTVDSGGNVLYHTAVEGDTVSTPLGALNTWHLIVAASDGATIYLSVDGAAFTTGTENNGADFFLNSTTTHVLAAAPTPDNYDGLLDEVMMFGVALSQSDVTTLWNGGVGKFYRP